jgi:lysophospholipid acyltransferase (LPLAT)-like uncharacterized protein
MRKVMLHGSPPLIYAFLKFLQSSIHWTEINAETARSLWLNGQQVIYAFWHGRMLMGPFFYRGRGLKILISRHADGELIRRVMDRFGLESVRGSSRRGGPGAFRELLRTSRQGWDIAITPDGPRGPRYVVQSGTMELARRTGLPILPVSYSTRHRVHLPSWDAHLLPRPFTKGVFIWGHPTWVNAEVNPQAQEAGRLSLETTLRNLTEIADNFFSVS